MEAVINFKKDISSFTVNNSNIHLLFNELRSINHYPKDENDFKSEVVFLRDNKIYFYTGLYEAIKDFLKTRGYLIKYTEIKNIIKHKRYDNLFELKTKLRDYQKEAVYCSAKKKRGIIKVGTGGGKTIISFGIMSYFKMKSLFITNQADMKNQVYESLISNTNLKEDDVLIFENKKKDYSEKKVTITTMSMINNIKDDNFFDNFGLIIIDECHHAGAEKWFSNINKFNCFHKIGLSATPGREDAFRNRVFSSIGKIIYEKKAVDLQKKGYLLKLNCVFIEYPSDYKYNKIENKIHYSRVENKYIVQNKKRNDFIISKIKKLYNQKRTILVLVKTINHAEILFNEINFGKKIKMTGSENQLKNGSIKRVNKNPSKRKPYIEKIKNGEYNIIIATKIFNEAMDISNLSACVNVASGSSSIETVQKIGRILRLQKDFDNAVYYDIFDIGEEKGKRYFRDINPFYKQGVKRIKEIETAGFDIKFDINGIVSSESSKGFFI